jgi:hypothetical protein
VHRLQENTHRTHYADGVQACLVMWMFTPF